MTHGRLATAAEKLAGRLLRLMFVLIGALALVAAACADIEEEAIATPTGSATVAPSPTLPAVPPTSVPPGPAEPVAAPTATFTPIPALIPTVAPPPTTPEVSDRDGDGIPDPSDQCPDDPEDGDGFQDADGCPDPDNDGDGVLDLSDACPNAPETVNGCWDADGCPDSCPPPPPPPIDTDGDGIPDVTDCCPNEPEDPDDWCLLDGCPYTDDVQPCLACWVVP